MMSDVSLDDELLAAVGRSSHVGGKSRTPPVSSSPPKRKRGDQWNSDEDEQRSAGRVGDGENDEDSSERAGARSSSKSKSKMPLKKRLDKHEEEEEEEEEEEARGGYETDVSYNSDLYIDDEDEERLSKMSELDREMILLERSERRDALKPLYKRYGNNSHERHEKIPVSSSRGRTRDSQSGANKRALSKLVMARQQKGYDSCRKGSASKFGATRRPREGDGTDDDVGSENEQESLRSSRRFKQAIDKNFDDVDDDDADEQKDIGDPTFEHLCDITICRSKLAKWFMEPFFEDIIPGCFVRVAVGMDDNNNSRYRLCQVRTVDAQDPNKQYKFENRMTHKWLNLAWGESQARWQKARVSDQTPTQSEFEQWQEEVKRLSIGDKPSLMSMLDKKEAISKLGAFVYSADLVKKMLHEKKLAAFRPSNVAAEKDRLLKELALADSKDDHKEKQRIQAKLKDLEAYSMRNQKKNAKALALAEMNRRNRFENFKNASELKPNNQAKAGEAGYDPFSRRWTRSQNYYNRSAIAENAEGGKAREVAQEAAAETGKLIDTGAPLEDNNKMFLLHDFDLRISLAGIQKFGGAQGAPFAFIARKQRLEATCGVSVQSLDGNRHSMALTVYDYKRRRGLL